MFRTSLLPALCFSFFMACELTAEGTAVNRQELKDDLLLDDQLFDLTPEFRIAGPTRMCFDTGSTPVVAGREIRLKRCQPSTSNTTQRFTVVEADTVAHLIELKAGGLCVGARTSTDQAPLELQPCTNPTLQRFHFDGDSLILAPRTSNLVAEAALDDQRDGTPVVLGRRQLDDHELWTIENLTLTKVRPFSGLFSVSTENELRSALAVATPGTVIEISSAAAFIATSAFEIPAGVTVRGGRRGVNRGAEISVPLGGPEALFIMQSSDARLTGVRVRGPSSSNSSDLPVQRGVLARDVGVDRVFIDRCEFSNWPSSGVSVEGNNADEWTCIDATLPGSSRPTPIRVIRNSFHDNRRQGLGYGVVAGHGGFPLIEGNVFDENRHAIAADGRSRTGYIARYNLVLSKAPLQSELGYTWYTHDFDMHGRDNGGLLDTIWYENHRGGRAGDYVEIGYNTFLAYDREHYDLRGDPCRPNWFHHNVSLRGEAGALNNEGAASNLIRTDNKWSQVSPMIHQASTYPNAPAHGPKVADFDGDGLDDVFVATGAAWYISWGGQTEWRLLSRRTDASRMLRVGDFNGDGRADIFKTNDSRWFVSYGGTSPWVAVRSFTGQPTGTDDTPEELLTLDIDRNGAADVVLRFGPLFFFSRGANAGWELFPLTSPPSDCGALYLGRFGDLGEVTAICRRPDTTWYRHTTSGWQRQYRGPTADSFAAYSGPSAFGQAVDSDGDGRDEVSNNDIVWPFSQRWQRWPASAHLWGRFNTETGADLLFVSSDRHFSISSRGEAPRVLSLQTMR